MYCLFRLGWVQLYNYITTYKCYVYNPCPYTNHNLNIQAHTLILIISLTITNTLNIIKLSNMLFLIHFLLLVIIYLKLQNQDRGYGMHQLFVFSDKFQPLKKACSKESVRGCISSISQYFKYHQTKMQFCMYVKVVGGPHNNWWPEQC